MDNNFWEKRWQEAATGWDIGMASPAIIAYFEQITDKNVSILIPGCGNAHEAEALYALGFTNITLIDIAPTACKHIQQRLTDYPTIKVICGDFFEHTGQYDFIVEQTFFCALPPSLRSDYVKKMHELLKPTGKLIGLLFASHFAKEGPPFGGDIIEYKSLFADYFLIKQIAICENSIAPRKENELFIIFNNKKPQVNN